MLRYKTVELIKWAETDANGFDVLRLGVANEIEQKRALPPDAHQWLVRYLKGEAMRPPAKAGSKGDPWLHQLIGMAVWARIDEGMTATRNDATPLKNSACDAVAEAMAELGLQPKTFKGVKRIWMAYKKNTRQDLAIKRT